MAKIEIASKPLFQAGKNLNVQHMYVLYTDNNKNVRVLRGGPEGSNIQGALFGDIEVVDAPYSQDFIDYAPPGVNPSSEIWSGTDAQMQPLIDQMRSKMNYINSQGYDYNLPIYETFLPGTIWERLNNQNSNTVAYKLAKSAGLEQYVDNFVRDKNLDTPGYHSPLEHSPFEKTAESLGQAIKQAGKTIDDLMKEIGYDPKGQCISWGDPHLVTFDRTTYDFQKPGEFVLVGSRTDDFEIQVRQELMEGSDSISRNTAVATRFGNTKLGLYLPNKNASRIQGTPNDDFLQADGSGKLIFGAQDNGQANIITAGSAVFDYSQASYKNTFGYYIQNNNGNPVSGKVIWASISRNTQRGITAQFDDSVSIDKLGYFLIPNGRSYSNVADGAQVTFGQIDGSWSAYNNGMQLRSEYSNFNNPAHAFFSNSALNSDGADHLKEEGNKQSWEDTYSGASGSDRGFNDVLFYTYANQTVTINGGDVLSSGNGPDNFGYVIGSDGFDTVRGFNVSEDSLTFFSRLFGGNIQLSQSNGGTFIQTNPNSTQGQAGGVFVEGVELADLEPRIKIDNITDIQRSGLYIDGQQQMLQSGQLKAVGGGLIYREGDKYTLISASGDGFTADLSNDFIATEPFLAANRAPNTVYGLLGNNDGNRSNDLAFLNGTILSNPVLAVTLYGAFANSWRVNDTNRLFDYPDGRNTSEFDVPAFEAKYITADNFDPSQKQDARNAAIAAGHNPDSPMFGNILLELLAGGLNLGELANSKINANLYNNSQAANIVEVLPTLAPTPAPSPTPAPTNSPTPSPSPAPQTTETSTKTISSISKAPTSTETEMTTTNFSSQVSTSRTFSSPGGNDTTGFNFTFNPPANNPSLPFDNEPTASNNGAIIGAFFGGAVLVGVCVALACVYNRYFGGQNETQERDSEKVADSNVVPLKKITHRSSYTEEASERSSDSLKRA